MVYQNMGYSNLEIVCEIMLNADHLMFIKIFVFEQILDRAHFLPHIGSGEEVRTQYQQLCLALDEYIRKTFHEWTQTIDKVYPTKSSLII